MRLAGNSLDGEEDTEHDSLPRFRLPCGVKSYSCLSGLLEVEDEYKGNVGSCPNGVGGSPLLLKKDLPLIPAPDLLPPKTIDKKGCHNGHFERGQD